MPIKQKVNQLRQDRFRRVIGVILIFMLMSSGLSCAPGVSDSIVPALTLEAQQERISAILATSESVPTKIGVKIATPTLISVTATTENQLHPQLTPLTTTTPTQSPSIEPTPLEVLPSVTLTPIQEAAISTAVPISATIGATSVVPTIDNTEKASPMVYDIGQSSLGFPLTAYQFNESTQKIVVVGAIHGGYEWNTSLLAYAEIDYFIDHPGAVPDSLSLIIIPSANPDGQESVTGKIGRFSVSDLAADTTPGRFNGNGVDLNRNWDCQWAPEAVWRGRTVSGGDMPFSEPETIALRDFLLRINPAAVIFLHSAANGVFASGCPNTHQPSMDLARIYGEAAGYPVYETFSAYDVTGDAGDWLTLQGIPSISIELHNHENLDYEQNLAGMLALMESFK